MNCRRQARWCSALCAALQLAVLPLFAGNPANAPAPIKSSSAPTNVVTPARSPVELFRRLLAMSPDDRVNFLTNRTPDIRARILAKVAEYEALGPDTRELRLRATELRWYLMPLLRDAPTNRAALLARVPDDLHQLVQNRLEQWAILPPTLQQEFLDNERTLAYFTQMDVSNNPAENSGRGPGDADQVHWNSLSEAERSQITAGFRQFFELTPEEKQETLNTLSDAERQQMEKTLQAFDKMPASQRAECVNAFAKFASMDAAEQAEFLKNAARWSEMTPAERKAWRDLVVHVPQWPPLPAGFVVPIPGESNPAIATNRN
ncbi:MAG TPA: DUF3106 domain-containing protein [Candidatus Paceibacterota bacterium]|nr:DUF3106 domain-containing protein [Candidatus Paceibacterota bacterium]